MRAHACSPISNCSRVSERRRSIPRSRLSPPRGQAPSTGGEREPNDKPYGDVFFQEYGTNPFVDTDDDRLSTFGLDVDTGSYTVARRYLSDGNLPPREAIRVEEFVNAFSYGDRPPSRGDFAIRAEAAPTPFMKGATEGKCRVSTSIIDVCSTQSIPCFV